MKDKIFLINPGHGGMIDGVYQTAPKKMYTHPNGEIAYEGVINRKVASMVTSMMNIEGIKFINICSTNLDVPMQERVAIANTYVREYGKDNVIGIDLHSNAGNGEGFEIWTGPGQTKSDFYASMFYDEFARRNPSWKMRKDHSDGDPDKEANFYMLIHTQCPWILPEWGFFDNEKDWAIIKNSDEQLKYAQMIVNFAKRVLLKSL